MICALDEGGSIEVARHKRTTRGTLAINADHFPGEHRTVPGDYSLRPRNDAERAFLAIGEGAAIWLKEAAAAGTERIHQKVDHAI